MANKRILVADDELPLAKALSLKLTSVGYDVDTAQNGEEVLDLLSKNNYDLLVLDLVMPVKDGFGVLQEIRDKNIGIKIFVTSNLGQQEDMDKAAELGAIKYFVKSNTSLSEIISSVEKETK